MKITSIIMITFVLLLSNTVMAEEPQMDIDEFTQAKMRILQAVTTHLEILNKFKSCIEEATGRAEVGACRKSKKAEIKDLRMQTKQVRDEMIKAKEMDMKATEQAE